MTDPDRLIDRLLTEDGARWRAAQPAPPDPDPVPSTGPDRRSRWQPLAAAAVVTLVVAGGATAVAVSRDPAPAPVPGAAPADEVVRDGDRVAGHGTVLAASGQPVQMCLAEASSLMYPPSAPVCRTGVTVTGLDLDRLSGRHERDGTVWGNARVEGVYRDRTVTVSRQEAARPPAGPDAGSPDVVPCAEPAGGWTRPPDLEGAYVDLRQLVNRQPGELNEPFVTYPYGWHLQDRSGRKGTEVYVLGTTGDVAAARARALQVFPAEHLCVARVTWSKGAMDDAEHRLGTPAAVAAGIARVSTRVALDRVTVDLLVLDETASRFLAGVADGRVVPEPMLRKLA